MKTYKVTIYPVTPWTVLVEAETEEEAKLIALDFEGPAMPAYFGSQMDWYHDISEWPNIGNDGQVDVEEY